MDFKIVFTTAIKWTGAVFPDPTNQTIMTDTFQILLNDQHIQVTPLGEKGFQLEFMNRKKRVINHRLDDDQDMRWFFTNGRNKKLAKEVGTLIDRYLEQRK